DVVAEAQHQRTVLAADALELHAGELRRELGQALHEAGGGRGLADALEEEAVGLAPPERGGGVARGVVVGLEQGHAARVGVLLGGRAGDAEELLLVELAEQTGAPQVLQEDAVVLVEELGGQALRADAARRSPGGRLAGRRALFQAHEACSDVRRRIRDDGSKSSRLSSTLSGIFPIAPNPQGRSRILRQVVTPATTRTAPTTSQPSGTR